MKIAIFTDSYLPIPNGVTTGVDRTVRALEARGHTVIIVAPSVPDYEDERKNIYRLRSVGFATDSRFALHLPNKTLFKLVRDEFDIIHAHNGGPVSYLGWEMAKVKKIPYVFTYWTLLDKYTHYLANGLIVPPTAIRFFSKITCNLCDYILVPTKRVKNELLTYGITREIQILITGIKVENYIHHPKGFIRDKIGVGKETKILLHVGRLGKEKSVDFIITAFLHIKKAFPDSVLVLIGTGTEEKSLQSLVKKLQLQQSVYFLGSFHPDVISRVYSDADVFVFASQTETQGMVILESLASSVPIVAVEDEVFDGILVDGKNSYLVPKDTKLFANKVVDLLRDEKKRKNFAENAFQTAQRFSIDKTAEELEKIYIKLLAKHTKVSYRKKCITAIKKLFKR